MKDAAQNDRDLQQIIVWGSCLMAGFGTASLQALQPDFGLKVTWGTGVAFVLGGVALALFWKLMMNPARTRRQKITAYTILGIVAFAGYLYPARFVADDKRLSLFIGFTLALLVIGTICGVMLMLKRFFDADEREHSAPPEKL